MRCEEARRALSATADGEYGGDLRLLVRHVEECVSCGAFQTRMEEIRQFLRVEVVTEVPDVSSRVLAELARRESRPRPRRPVRLVEVAAAFTAGLVVAGALFGLGPGSSPHLAAADVPKEVFEAQASVMTMQAEVEVVERGWHPQVGVRRFVGALRYRAPESFALTLADESAYPSKEWVRNDVTVVIDEGRSWSRGPRDCPSPGLPLCTPREPRIVAVAPREPFSESTPVPLDLVVPVRSFTFASPPAALGRREVDGRSAVGVEVSAAQVAPLLGALRTTGNLREVHPADRVRLWLDDRALVPLELSVLPDASPERRRWALARGYGDEAGKAILEVRLTAVALNDQLPEGSFPVAPERATSRTEGFSTGEPTKLIGTPPGVFLAPHRSGVVQLGAGPRVEVRSWADGRAWLKVRATDEWTGKRLFGDLGEGVRQTALPNGIAYVGGDGTRVALHGDDIDVVVTGSLEPAALLRVASGLGIEGLPVPDDWHEADTAGIAEARAAYPGLLLLGDVAGFGPPALRVVGDTVVARYAGPGTRAFQLFQTRDARLSPPLDTDARGLMLRGTVARFSPARGELEWIEEGKAVALTSTSLPLGELIAIAEALEPA